MYFVLVGALTKLQIPGRVAGGTALIAEPCLNMMQQEEQILNWISVKYALITLREKLSFFFLNTVYYDKF